MIDADPNLAEELYLFGEQANAELTRQKKINDDLLERCADLQVKADRLELALDRCIEICRSICREHHLPEVPHETISG